MQSMLHSSEEEPIIHFPKCGLTDAGFFVIVFPYQITTAYNNVPFTNSGAAKKAGRNQQFLIDYDGR
jgi:hypothetical protein